MTDRITISLTDFVDFAIKSGSPKLTKVRQLKSRPPYKPAHDFWRPLREEIVELHRLGRSKGDLDTFLSRLTDQKKRGNYARCVKGYKKFLGRRQVQWFDPPSSDWRPEGLRIKINPEIGLQIAGDPHVIKLYFKKEKLSKNRVEIIRLLMDRKLTNLAPDDTRFAVLDIPRGKLFAAEAIDGSLAPLLNGEAAALKRMWDQVRV